MTGAIIMFFPVVMLAVAAIAFLVWGIVSLRVSRSAGILRIVAGLGVAGATVLSMGMFFFDVQYGVLLFPILGFIVGFVWAVPWLIAAAVASSRARRAA